MLKLLTEGFPLEEFASLLNGGCPAEPAADFLTERGLPLVDVLLLYARDAVTFPPREIPAAVRTQFEQQQRWTDRPIWNHAGFWMPEGSNQSAILANCACGRAIVDAWPEMPAADLPPFYRVELEQAVWRDAELHAPTNLWWIGRCANCGTVHWTTIEGKTPEGCLLSAIFREEVLVAWLKAHGDDRHVKISRWLVKPVPEGFLVGNPIGKLFHLEYSDQEAILFREIESARRHVKRRILELFGRDGRWQHHRSGSAASTGISPSIG